MQQESFKTSALSTNVRFLHALQGFHKVAKRTILESADDFVVLWCFASFPKLLEGSMEHSISSP